VLSDKLSTYLGDSYMHAPWYRPFRKAFRSGCYLAAHAVEAFLIIGLIAAIQRALIWDGDPRLFDVVPLRYPFDAVDIGILAAFLIFGTREAMHAFRGDEDE
jgi:hypothetical protein